MIPVRPIPAMNPNILQTKEVRQLKKHIKAILITIAVILAALVLLHVTINFILPQIAAMHSGMF